MPDGWSAALRLLPEALGRTAAAAPEAWRASGEEFRLRRGRAPTLLVRGTERRLREAPVEAAELRCVLDRATGSSYHAAREQLRRGFLGVEGGLRLGVCGDARGDVEAVSSLCLRIPRQIPEAGAGLLDAPGDESLLILSPPGGGKTTLLRELVRRSAQRGRRVGLADERGEVAAVWQGSPQFELGPCTDVVSFLPKAEAVLLLLRAMNPQIIALDEISDPADLEAVRRISGCGVVIFATAHAASPAALRAMPRYRELLEAGVFRRAVTISGTEMRRYRLEAL